MIREGVAWEKDENRRVQASSEHMEREEEGENLKGKWSVVDEMMTNYDVVGENTEKWEGIVSIWSKRILPKPSIIPLKPKQANRFQQSHKAPIILSPSFLYPSPFFLLYYNFLSQPSLR